MQEKLKEIEKGKHYEMEKGKHTEKMEQNAELGNQHSW
jgi:hypothetical protein